MELYYISIHAPHEGVRRGCRPKSSWASDFNPRTPRGGATRSLFPLHSFLNFNPRTPRGGATDVSEHHQPVIFISIHAPHEGVRRAGNPTCRNVSRFQSTHPTRGCDLDAKGVDKTSKISIHAPHEGVRLFVGRSVSAGISDISIHAPHEGVRRFPMTNRDRLIISIHAPHEGVRQANAWREPNAWQFQSTHPTRGCDQPGRWTWTTYKHFNPRTPRGGATWILGRPGLQISISIHAPHEGVRPIGISSGVISLYFNPRTPRGGATFLCLLQ